MINLAIEIDRDLVGSGSQITDESLSGAGPVVTAVVTFVAPTSSPTAVFRYIFNPVGAPVGARRIYNSILLSHRRVPGLNFGVP